MASIQVRRERRGDWDVIHYAGPMNEEAGIHLLPLFDDARPKCVFNLAAVTSINSKGTAVWMNFLRTFRDGREIGLEEVAPCFVGLINMMPSMTMGVKVRSIFAPFACDGCGARLTRLVAFGGSTPLTLSALSRSVKCPKCQESMELEEEPEIYFHFALEAGLVLDG